MLGEHGPWAYFDHKDMLVPESDYGYNPITFEKQELIDELNKQVELIEFLEPKCVEDDEDGNKKTK